MWTRRVPYSRNRCSNIMSNLSDRSLTLTKPFPASISLFVFYCIYSLKNCWFFYLPRNFVVNVYLPTLCSYVSCLSVYTPLVINALQNSYLINNPSLDLTRRINHQTSFDCGRIPSYYSGFYTSLYSSDYTIT